MFSSLSPGLHARSAPPPPEECVLAAALALLPVRESGAANRGEFVDTMNAAAGAPLASPWCASYVRHAGHYALLDPISGYSRWPLPDTASCQQLADFARAHDVLDVIPMRGDVFLLWSDVLQRFHHTGFVLAVADAGAGFECLTIEGNTNADGSPDGYEVAVRTRQFPGATKHRFIDWVKQLTVASSVSSPASPSTHASAVLASDV